MARRPKPWYRKSRQAWFVTINGTQHNLGPEKEEAYDCFYQLMRQPRGRTVSPQSLAAIIDVFLEWVERNRSTHSYEWYRYRLQRFIERYPDLRAADLRPFHVQTWADSYTLSVTSRRNYLRSVKRCMRWAKVQGYLDLNPIGDMEVPRAESRTICISQAEFDVLMSHVRNDAFADLLTVTWETGCRPQESLRVEARHVDVANQRWVFPKSESKMKRMTRVVYMTDTAMQIVRRRMLTYPEGPLFRNTNGKPWTKYSVSCSFLKLQVRMGKDEMKLRGEDISDESIAKLVPTLKPARKCNGTKTSKSGAEMRCEAKRKLIYKRASQLAPKYSLYALRHSWATNALKNGVDSLTVAILMGHEDPSTLAKVYQHLSLNPRHLLEQARRAVS